MNKTIAILGGGPAGLSCALWLKQLGFAPAVIEQSPKVGGIQRSSNYVNNYYLGLAGNTGHQVAEQFARHAEAAGLPSLLAARIESIAKSGNAFTLRVAGTQLEAQAVVIATGQRMRGPEAMPAIQADWSQLSEHVCFDPGKSPLLMTKVKHKVVAVVGGGDNAMSTAVMLGETATYIHLLSRSSLHGFSCNQEAIRERQKTGRLTLHQPATIQSLERDAERIRLVFQVSGGESQALLVDHVCFRLGFSPNTEEVAQLLKTGEFGLLALKPSGHILTDPFQRTSIPRVYAAGDVTNVENPCVATAVAQGAIVARTMEGDLAG